MSQPPLTLYAPVADPAGVLRILRQAGDVEVDGTERDWTEATVRWKTGWFSKTSLTVRHDPDYYGGADWPAQMQGMAGYFLQLGARPEIARIPSALRFALSFPDAPPPVDEADPVHALLHEIANHLDGVFFLPGHLLDAHGLLLAGPEGAYDPAAAFPGAVDLSPPEPVDDEEEEPEPPDATRVARRALVLGALTMRALTEVEAPPEIREQRRDVPLRWLTDVGADDELEPFERAYLEDADAPPQQATINAIWRTEGLAVLLWALGLAELPRYDQLGTPPEQWAALGVLLDPSVGRAVVDGATLRSPEELTAMGEHLLAFHWRMVDFRVRPAAMDFVAFSKNCWFGSFSLDDFEIIDQDLALEGHPIAQAPPEVLGRSASAAMERHLAINWLRGYARIYSETDVST